MAVTFNANSSDSDEADNRFSVYWQLNPFLNASNASSWLCFNHTCIVLVIFVFFSQEKSKGEQEGLKSAAK
jgi:hypothetical protein